MGPSGTDHRQPDSHEVLKVYFHLSHGPDRLTYGELSRDYKGTIEVTGAGAVVLGKRLRSSGWGAGLAVGGLAGMVGAVAGKKLLEKGDDTGGELIPKDHQVFYDEKKKIVSLEAGNGIWVVIRLSNRQEVERLVGSLRECFGPCCSPKQLILATTTTKVLIILVLIIILGALFLWMNYRRSLSGRHY